MKYQYNKIATTFILLIFPPTLLSTLFMGITMGWILNSWELKRHANYQREQLQQIQTLLIEPMYYFEYRTVESIAKTAISNKNITYIQIQDDLGNIITSLGTETESSHLYQLPINKFSTKKRQNLDITAVSMIQMVY